MAYAQQNPYYQESVQDAENGRSQGIASGAEQIELKQHYGDSPKGSFLSRVQHTRSEIDGLDGEINNIGRLHQRILSSPDGQAKDQLEQHTTQIQVKFTAIKDEIKSLERDVASLPSSDDRENKSKQLNAIRKRFQDYLGTYQKSEQKYRQSCETQFERQIKIAYPDATEPEVRHMMDNWDSEKVFQTAMGSERQSRAYSALGNAAARHNEIERIEKTMAELAVLYQELATVVEQQEPVVEAAERNAEQTNQNLEAGNVQVKRATISARRARKLKWWCLFIVVLIIIAIALGVGLGICLTGNKCK